MTTPILGPDSLGKEDFLRLLVTQLRHQDPLQPLDAQDFASQLAQFTALEQQIRTNELLEAELQYRDAGMLEDQKTVAIGLIGHGVVTPGNRVELKGAGDAAYVSTSEATGLTIRLTDGAGRVAFSVDTTVAAGGVHRIDLAGAQNLAPGAYTLTATQLGGSQPVTITPLASGTVQGVRWGATGPVLVVGGREVPLSEIIEVNN